MFIIIFFYILYFVICLIISGFTVHELGHILAAKYYNKKLEFIFSYGKLFNFIYVPRFIWYMPEDLTLKQKFIISIAGFTFEFIFSIMFYILGVKIFLLTSLVHLFLYKFYAGNSSDFYYIKEYINSFK